MQRVALALLVRGAALRRELGPFLRRQHHVLLGIRRIGKPEQRVLRLDRREAAHDRRVHVLVVGDLEDHLLVHAGRVRLRHRPVEPGPARRAPTTRSASCRAARPGTATCARAARDPSSSRAISAVMMPGGHEEHRAHARHRHVQEDRARPPARLLPLLAAARLHERVVAGPLREPVAVGIRGARQVDEARVELVQRVVPDAEAVGDAGPERLDDHVGVGRELAERVGAGRAASGRRSPSAATGSTPRTRCSRGTGRRPAARP